LALAVPSAQGFSARLALNASIGLGTVPVLWWFHWPIPDLSRTAVITGVLVGGLVWWCAAGGAVTHRLRRLVPGLARADAAPVAAAVLSTAALWPMVAMAGSRRALAFLLKGWDNCAHYEMFDTIEYSGCDMTCSLLPFGNNSWQIPKYPQGFHTVLAAIWEFFNGGEPGTWVEHLAAFPKLVAVLTIVVVTMMVAGIAALVLNRRSLTLPLLAAIAIVTVYVLGPGAYLIYAGFASFVYTCAAVVQVGLVAGATRGKVRTADLAAIAALGVTVANNWLALAPIAASGLALVWTARGWAGRPKISVRPVTGAVIALLGCLGSLRAIVPTLKAATARNLLEITAGISVPDTSATIAICSLVLAAALLVNTSHTSRASVFSARMAAVPPLVASTIALALGGYLVWSGTPLGYYFWKLVWGLIPIAVPFGFVILARAFPIRAWSGADGTFERTFRVVGVALIAVAVSQFFGLTVPTGDAADTTRASIATLWRDTGEPGELAMRAAGQIIATAKLQRSDPELVYVLVSDLAPIRPQLAQFWIAPLSGGQMMRHWNDEISPGLADLAARSNLDAAGTILQSCDTCVTVLPTEADAEGVRQGLGHRLDNRVKSLQ
jgi:hypothetical protein